MKQKNMFLEEDLPKSLKIEFNFKRNIISIEVCLLSKKYRRIIKY